MFKPFPKNQLLNILKIGIPSASESISYNFSQIVVTSFINLLGANSMATKSYVGTIVCFSFIFASAIGQGGSILIGRFIGSNEGNNAYKLCMYTIKKAVLVSISISLIIALVGRGIIGILTSNEEIISIATIIFLVEIFLEPGRCINLVGINGLRAVGDVKFPLYIGVFSMWTFGVGLSYTWNKIWTWLNRCLDWICN